MPKPPPVALTGIRDILVGLTEEGRGDETASALGIGLSLAGMAGAHLTVQSAARRLTMVGGSGWGFVNDLVAQENRRLSARARAIAERAATDATLEGVSCSIEASALAYPELVGRLTARARLADLTILDAEAREVDLDRDVIDGVLFGSGRPLLVVPPGGDTFSARRIVIAWDGSAQAARAANDALPFLRAAEAVEIVSVVGEKDLDLGRGRRIRPASRAPRCQRLGDERPGRRRRRRDAETAGRPSRRGDAGDRRLPAFTPEGMVPRRCHARAPDTLAGAAVPRPLIAEPVFEAVSGSLAPSAMRPWR